jgi:hypothetical protein
MNHLPPPFEEAERERWMYSSRRLVKNTEFPRLERTIGVCVGAPSYHHGLRCMAVELHTERPTLGTVPSGTYVPVDTWQAEAAERIRHAIHHIDAIIKELHDHRAQLETELAVLPMVVAPESEATNAE